MGRVRELTFVSPVKMRMGISPSSAHCHQTQRYRLFEGGAHLVLESSQTMNDIPFGDHFTVESRWDFSALTPAPDGAPRTKVSESSLKVLNFLLTAAFLESGSLQGPLWEVHWCCAIKWKHCMQAVDGHCMHASMDYGTMHVY